MVEAAAEIAPVDPDRPTVFAGAPPHFEAALAGITAALAKCRQDPEVMEAARESQDVLMHAWSLIAPTLVPELIGIVNKLIIDLSNDK